VMRNPRTGAAGLTRRRLRISPGRQRDALRRLSAVICAMIIMCMLMAFGGTSVALAATAVTVSARQPWTDTGIDVGGSVTLHATGTIGVGGPEGNLGPGGSKTGCVAGPSSFSGKWVLNGPPCWSLIGRVGNGRPFAVGGGGKFKVPSGRFYLGVDDEVAAFGDNSGSWKVSIGSAASNAQPSTLQIAQVGRQLAEWLASPWRSLTEDQRQCLLGHWDNCMRDSSMQAIMGSINPATWKRVLQEEFGWIRNSLTPQQRACLAGDFNACK